MGKRPDFREIKTYEEFAKYYWYREELSTICKQLNIDSIGTKKELNDNIKEYFHGNLIRKKRSYLKKEVTREISLDSPLLDCGFSFNQHFREFFSQETGIKNFKFTADMAAAWRKVKQENNRDFTIQDMLNIYYQKSDYAKYDNSSCEWNIFLKDFCADEKNAVFHNKLKVASILWNIVKNSEQPKKYSYELVENHWDLVKQYL